MNNPYARIEMATDLRPRSWVALDIGRLALLVTLWLAVTYSISLPSSNLLAKDSALIAMSPILPIALLSVAIAGETIWALLLTVCAFPTLVAVAVGIFGVRKRRAWIAAISMGILYGLFLRLFYGMCDIA